MYNLLHMFYFLTSNLAGGLGRAWKRWKYDTRLVIKFPFFSHFRQITSIQFPTLKCCVLAMEPLHKKQEAQQQRKKKSRRVLCNFVRLQCVQSATASLSLHALHAYNAVYFLFCFTKRWATLTKFSILRS